MSLLMAGCIPIGYAYPTVSYIPATPVSAPTDEVHAFRVDVADDDNSPEFAEDDEYVLQRLPLEKDGRFDSQVKVSVDYGWFWNWIAYVYDEYTHHTLMVRLYRPGYHTIEIESWQKTGKVEWQPAKSLDEQEKAIDDLLSTWTRSRMSTQHLYNQVGPPRDSSVFRYLAAGTASDEHLQALQFAASEYERLQKEVTDAAVRSRLESKAKALRKLADN
jgi:hypothetical protein